MTERHDYQTGDSSQVSVGELIDRVGREGLPVRLANWPQRVAPDDLPVDEWPTGELPRIAEYDSTERPGRDQAALGSALFPFPDNSSTLDCHKYKDWEVDSDNIGMNELQKIRRAT
jgi:hypothetical protein